MTTIYCHDRNPRNMGMVCSLPAGHVSPHAFGDGGTWPTTDTDYEGAS